MTLGLALYLAAAQLQPSALVEPTHLLERSRAMVQSLDYDQALPLIRRLLDDPSLPTDVRAEAFALEGSVLAVTADISEAEKPFRKLLRLRPDWELPPRTAPKILAAFRKVQADERAVTAELELSQRAKTLSKLKLVDELPTTARGGKALRFSVRVYDPDASVSAVEVPYRLAGDKSYSVLALQRDESGAWTGAIPAELTTSSTGLKFEAYLTTRDAKGGTLLTRGTSASPVTIEVAAGRPKLPRTVFFVALGFSLASLATGVGLRLALAQTQGSIDAVLAGQTASAPQYAMLRDTGIGLSTANKVAWPIAIGLSLGTVLLALFGTDWSP